MATASTGVVAAAGPNLRSADGAPSAADQVARAMIPHADLVSHDGRTDFHLRLEPPNLGTVHIHLSATEQTLTARVVVMHESTQVLLASQEHDLRQSLAQAGITLGGFDVTHDGGGSSGRGQQSPEQSFPPDPLVRQLPRATPARAASRVLPGVNILA